ncbi:MAG: transposase [Gammaproteobacteria bacterium]|nr:transposase [Gammaproteobacteria bacterium]
MARYGQVFKERAAARLLPPESSLVVKVARELGMAPATLERWCAQALVTHCRRRRRSSSCVTSKIESRSENGVGTCARSSSL